MIFTIDQLHEPGSPFGGQGLDPLDWASRLPDLSVFAVSVKIVAA